MNVRRAIHWAWINYPCPKVFRRVKRICRNIQIQIQPQGLEIRFQMEALYPHVAVLSRALMCIVLVYLQDLIIEAFR